MKKFTWSYVGLDTEFIKTVCRNFEFKDISIDCIISSNLEQYIQNLEQNLLLFVYDFENPPFDVSTFLNLQKDYEIYPLNIGIYSDENQVQNITYVFLMPKERLNNRETILNLLLFAEVNKEKFSRILQTWEQQTELINNIPLGMYRTKASGEFIFANSELLRILEVPNISILLQTNASQYYVNPQDRINWINLITNNKIVRNFEFKLKTFTGKIRWIRNNARGVFQKGELVYIEGFLEDITEEKRLREKEARINEKSLQQRLLLIDLFKLRSYFVEDLESAFKEIVVRSLDVLDADRVGIWVNENDNSFICRALYDREQGNFVDGMAFNTKTHSRYINVLNQGIQICTPNIINDLRLSEIMDTYLIPNQIKTVIDTPIFVGDRTWGIFKVEYRKSYEIDREDEWFCHILSFYISNIVETNNALAAKMETKAYALQLEKAYNEVIDLLAKIVEERDPYTAGHQKKVALIAQAIARELGYPENKVKRIYVAGMLHDIGKLYVPSEILTKPTRLSNIEYEIIKVHPTKGYETLKSMKYLEDIAELVYQHHERLDGSGYPRGLKGEEILPEAKILAVADVVEAMLARRPYRPPIKVEEVFQYLESNKGKLFDPIVVETLKKIFQIKIKEITEANSP
ncbi:MAG: HD domain-containing phosphohydrolase [Candidatus Hydrothermia bacterium]